MLPRCCFIPSKFVSSKLTSNPFLNIPANSFTLSIRPSNIEVSSLIVLVTSKESVKPALAPPPELPLPDPLELSVSFGNTFKLSNDAKLFDAFFASFPAFFALSPTPDTASDAVPA